MADNMLLNSVYNHYLTSYAPKSVTQYDTHKKSELRSVYNSIVKLNKESPLYILNSSKDTRAFAVGIKENARELHNTIASLGGLSEEELLNKKTAYSSKEGIATADFIGELPKDGNGVAPSFTLEVSSLASEQVNLGEFLPDEPVALPEDTYSFDINVNDLNYEFQFNIHENESNLAIQNRLAKLISNADVGLKASVISDDNNNNALKIESESTGLVNGRNSIFSISDDRTSKASGAVDYFGIDYTARPASNAVFLVNGEKQSTSSNHFTVGKMFEVQLNGISPVAGETTTIGLKTDVDSLADNVDALVGGYNNFIKAASEYTSNHPKSRQLLNEMLNLASLHEDNLSQVGLSMEEDGSIKLDRELLKDSAIGENGLEYLSTIREFTGSLLRKTNQVSLNPMQYADKTIVAYKNPGHNFNSPYITSAYSGMMFNSYC